MGIVTLKGGHMKVEFGLYKRVFIFNKIVIKIPKHLTIHSILEVYTEKWFWLFSSKEVKNKLLKIYYVPILPIVIQPKVKVYTEEDIKGIVVGDYNLSDVKADIKEKLLR